jgi:transcriptional regulator with XRE-family HTH domain
MPKRRDRDRSAQEDVLSEGLGRAIKVLRAGQDLSRHDLAERAGLSYSYLAEIENGAKSPSSRALAAIAEGLGLELHELVEAASSWRTPLSEEEGLETRTWAPRMLAAAPVEEIDAEASLEDATVDFAQRLEPRGEMPAPTRAPKPRRAPVSRRGFDLRQRLGIAPAPAPRDRIPPALLNEIQAGNCIAFVGAGFSAAAGLPGWGELLTLAAEQPEVSAETRAHIAERVTHGSAHALDEAAQVLEDELGRVRFLAQLERHLGHPSISDTMESRVRCLLGIPFRTILTTNFDGVLSGETTSHDAYRNALRPARYRWWETRYWGEAEGAFTLKLHGDLSRATPAESVVLTRRDYRRRLYEDPAYETFLRAVMATTTALYMGFSFEDAYLNELRSEILALLGQDRESSPVAYAIVNDVPEETRHHFRRHEGIEILSYDTDGGRDFSGFDAYLRAIHDATNPLRRFANYLEHKRILWVDPHPENNEAAFAHLAEAARGSGREGTALVTLESADAGLRALEAAAAEPFDLAITHWGEDAARDDAGRPIPAAVCLLSGIRARDLRCPVLVFASRRDAERRKRTALGLGAQGYCFRFQELYQAIERVLAPGDETG